MPSVPFCARVTLNPSLESSSSRPSRISTSSSTTRMSPLVSDGLNGVSVISSGAYRLPRGGCNLGERQFDAELGAPAGAVGNLDGTAMLLNDPISHRQPQASALARGLGGEERVVDAVQVAERHPAAKRNRMHRVTVPILSSGGEPGAAGCHQTSRVRRVPVDNAASVRTHIDPAILLGVARNL